MNQFVRATARHTMRCAVGLVVAALVLAGCGGGASSTPGRALPPAAPGTTTPQGDATGPFSYDSDALKGASLIGPATLGTLSVDLVTKMRDPLGLMRYAQEVNTPHSGMYRQFLTPQEIGDQFGAPQSDYDAATHYFRVHGLSVTGWPQRMMLHVSGTQANIEAALSTRFAWYSRNGQTFLAPMSAPILPAVIGVTGSPDIVQQIDRHVDSVRVQDQGNGLIYGFAPQQIAAAFDYTGAYNAGYTGAGITVGIIGTGGLSPADVPAYKALFHVPGSGSVTVVAATDADNAGRSASGFAPPLPVTKPCYGSAIEPTPKCNPEDGETQIDTEQVAGLAYNADVHYYLAYNPNDGCGAIAYPCPPGAGIPLQGLGEVDAELQTAIAENASDVISISFGGAEQPQVGSNFNANGYGFQPLEYAALASEGIAIFASSGDSGAEGCQRPYYPPDADSMCVSFPATDPNVVAVGGVNSPLDAAGRIVGPLTGWGQMTSGGYSGSGGGVSAYFPQPLFQQGAAGITGGMRNVPDVSLDGDSLTGVTTVIDADPAFGKRVIASYGGTSVAAPEMAAMWALVLQACKQSASCAKAAGPYPYRLGNPNVYFYKLYANAKTYAATFYDVLYGNNGELPSCQTHRSTPTPKGQPTPTPCPSGYDPGYNAGTGYDLVTGIGVPFARTLISQVTGQ